MENDMDNMQKENQQDINNKKLVNTGLACLDIVARMNRVDIDMRAMVKEFGIDSQDLSAEELLRIAKTTGFKIKNKNLKIKDISPNYPLPAIAQLENESYVVILGIKSEENRVLVLNPLSAQPEAFVIEEFEKQINGKIFILKSFL